MLVVTKASPVSYQYLDEQIVQVQNWGGVSSALLGGIEQGGTWVAVSEGNADSERVDRAGVLQVRHGPKTFKLKKLFIEPKTLIGFLDESNEGLWYLSHIVDENSIPEPRFTIEGHLAYEEVNEIGALATLEMLASDTSKPVLVQDFQWSKFAVKAREHGMQNPLGTFIHIPVPSGELIKQKYGPNDIRTLMLKNYINDLLKFDIVGVHTHEYSKNLVETVIASFGEGAVKQRNNDTTIELPDGRLVTIAVQPIGVDVLEIEQASRTNHKLRASVGGLPAGRHDLGTYINSLKKSGAHVIGSLERIDPTKGIRIGDIEWLLKRGHRVAYIGVFPQSRTDQETYAAELTELIIQSERINNAHKNLGYQPITIVKEGIRPPQNYLYLQMLDTAFLAHKRDGYDLVALEYILSHGQINEQQRGNLIVGNCGVRERLEEFSHQDGVYITAGLNPTSRQQALEQAVLSGNRISDKLVKAIREKSDVNDWIAALQERLYRIKR